MSNSFGSVDKCIDTKETFTALSGKYSVQKTYENIRKKKLGREKNCCSNQIYLLYWSTFLYVNLSGVISVKAFFMIAATPPSEFQRH